LEHIYYIERLRYDKFYGRQNIMGIEFVSTEQIDVYIKKLEDELVRKFGAPFLQRVETKKQKLFGIDGVFTQDANLQRFLMVIKKAYVDKKIPIVSETVA